MLQKLEYIHNNPVRRGYVDDPVHWRYSSARNYAGKAGLLDVITDWRGNRPAGRACKAVRSQAEPGNESQSLSRSLDSTQGSMPPTPRMTMLGTLYGWR